MTTKMFFVDVRRAHKILSKMKVNNIIAQLLTGHGGFGEYLFRFKLKSNPYCECDGGVCETVLHILTECPRFGFRRIETEQILDFAMDTQNFPSIIEDDSAREAFLKFAINSIKIANNRNNSIMKYAID